MTASGDRELRVFEVQQCDMPVHVQTTGTDKGGGMKKE